MTTQPNSRPNIIVCLVDDLGFSDIGCYGSEILTPNLDRMGNNGLRFTQMYNAARCCPSRAALLTGLYPHQAGVGHMVQNYGRPGYQGYLNDSCVTVAEVLRTAESAKQDPEGLAKLRESLSDLYQHNRYRRYLDAIGLTDDELQSLLDGAEALTVDLLAGD